MASEPLQPLPAPQPQAQPHTHTHPLPHPQSHGEPRPKPKRIKIDVACDACRTRKIKCDGIRPACGNCSKKLSLRDTCTYSQNNNSVTPRRASDIRPSNRPQLSPHHAGLNFTPRPAVPPSQLPIQAPKRSPISNASPADKSTGDYSGSRLATVNNMSPSVIDSMTAVVDEGASTREYFGSSSAGSFTAQIKKAIDARSGHTTHPSDNSSPARRAVKLAPVQQRIVSDAHRVLPTRRQADHLLTLYWTYVDPLYPFLDRYKWEESYRGIFDGTAIDVEEHTFLATLNVIFALSTQLLESQTPEQREESSNVYFNRAQELLPLNTWDAGAIDLVQYLLLTSQYLQSTDHPHQTWMTVGSAIRIAQGLGLHLTETSAEQSNVNDRELLRRIWYGCVLMDRMVAVTHGRPSMISPNLATVVPLPICSADPVHTEGGVLRTDASFFVSSVQLYEIIRRTIHALYHGTGARSKNVTASDNDCPATDDEQIELGTVLQLDGALARWERKLPERIQWSSLEPRGEIAHRQSVILHIRLCHARILLLRPILGSFCLAHSNEPSPFPDSLETRVFRECALLCVSTAQEVISTLLKHQVFDGTVGLLPAWWYRVYYVYTAATVLIAAKLRPEVFPGAELSRSWSQAMSVLKTHEKFGPSARRCVAALHFLSAKMVQDGPSSEPPSRGTMHHEESGDRQQRQSSTDAQQPQQQQQQQQQEQQPQIPDELSFSFGDLNQFGLQDVEFDVNNLSWLNDMHATWELLNHG